jgi:hypothetical protein
MHVTAFGDDARNRTRCFRACRLRRLPYKYCPSLLRCCSHMRLTPPLLKTSTIMFKRALSPGLMDDICSLPPSKKQHCDPVDYLKVNRRCSDKVSAHISKHPPLKDLVSAMGNRTKSPPKGEAVVYWMRMQDMRGSSSVFCPRDMPKRPNSL